MFTHKSQIEHHDYNLSRYYINISLIIICIAFIFYAILGLSIMRSQERERELRLLSQSRLIERSLTDIIRGVSDYARMVGEKALYVEDHHSKEMSRLFAQTYSMDSSLRNIYSWVMLDWANIDDNIAITSHDGELTKPYPVPDYYPLNLAKENPWQIHMGDVHLVSGFDNYTLLPIAIGIDDLSGKYRGTILTTILLERINRTLNEASRESDVKFVVLREKESLDVIAQSIHDGSFMLRSEDKAIIKQACDNEKEIGLLNDPIDVANIEYSFFQKSRYPFIILVGFDKEQIREDFWNELLPYVFQAGSVTVIFLIILFIFRTHIIVPLINQLRTRVEEETSARKENQRMLLHTMNNIPGFIYRCRADKHLSLELISKGCYELTGYKQADFIDRERLHLVDMIADDHRSDILKQIRQNVAERRAFRITYPITTSNGATKWVLNQATPVQLEQENDWVLEGLITDVTELKRTEQRMEAFVHKLELSNKELERFAYICSHDLKEPLRTIANFVQLLKKHLEKKDQDQEATEFIEHVETGTLRMKSLIENILLYSKVGIQKQDFALVDMNEVMRYVCRALARSISEKEANVNVNNLPVIQGHQEQMIQLLQNLVSNALKFNENPFVKVEIDATEETNFWKFSVADNGLGIAEEYHQKIFELFQRLHSKDSYTGTGIGLALCHKIVEQHGGEIWVESEVGKGTTFYFTIPKGGEGAG